MIYAPFGFCREEEGGPAASEIGKVKATTQGGSDINAVCPSMYHRQLNHQEGSSKILRYKVFGASCVSNW